MITIKLTDEALSDLKSLAEEKAWLQSGVDALKNAEANGYAYTAEEMNNELNQLKETLVNMNNIESNASVSLGTLGVKSNGDNCALKFSSLNDFSLIHDTSGSLLKRYQLSYLGRRAASNTEPAIALDSCVISTQILTFNTYGNMPDTMEEGWYQDRVTITLTAE